jgi:hypothetical protein
MSRREAKIAGCTPRVGRFLIQQRSERTGNCECTRDISSAQEKI